MIARRVFVLGLDGLNLKTAARLSRLGALPLFETAMERGQLASLDTAHPTGEANWQTLLTGVDPGWHGRFGDGSPVSCGASVPTVVDLLRGRGERIKTLKTLDGPIPDPPPGEDAGEDGKTIRRLTARALGTLGRAVREWRRPDGGSVIVRIGEVAQALAIETDHADFNHPAGDLAGAAALSRMVRDLVGDCLNVLAQVVETAGEGELAIAFSPLAVEPANRVISLAAALERAGWADRASASGCFVRLKRKGRDEDGALEPGRETAQAAEELAAILAGITDPANGAPAIRRVRPAAELYTGDRFDDAPDLVCETYPGYRFACDAEEGGEPVRPARSVGRVSGRDHRFGNGAGLVFCHRALARDAQSPAGVSRLVFDFLELERHPFADGGGSDR